jgi:nuclear pore complex protein Nup43
MRCDNDETRAGKPQISEKLQTGIKMKPIDQRPPTTSITTALTFNNRPEWQPAQDHAVASVIAGTNAKRFRNLTHTGKRVSKIRWLRSGSSLALPNHNATEYFVTGSWGEEENEVCLWRLSIDGEQEEDRNALIDKICPFSVIGNVSGIVSFSEDKFAFTTSRGVLATFKVLEDSDEQGISSPSAIHPASASQLHVYKKTKDQCPATGIATNLDSIVTVGEEGSIYQVSLETNEVVRSLESVDPVSITTVEFIGREEIVTGNICGQVKIYDLRAPASNGNKPGRTVHDYNEITGIKSLAQHPSQNHMILVGYESGQLAMQDLRQNSATSGSSEPVAYLPPQSGAVSEMHFHQVNPDHFFTGSQNGELVNWMPGEPDVEMDGRFEDPTPVLPDLNLECLKYGFMSKVMYSSQFPLNSLSISAHNRLIAGGDSGFAFCTELTHL